MSVSPEDKIVRGSDLTIVGSQIKTKLSEKQETLVSGTNIKTINNETILGGGNISIASGRDGVGFDSVASPQDGTMTITLSNDDTIVVDMNHTHPAYVKYYLCEDEAEYESIDSPYEDTLYLIPEEE